MISIADSVAELLRSGSESWERGDAKGAEAAFRAALESAPSEGALHFNLGLSLDRQGRSEEALAAYRTAVEHAPTLVQAWHNAGLLLLACGHVDDARRLFTRVLVLEPDSLEARNALGNVERKAGRLDKARRWYEEVVAREPAHRDALNNLGVVLDESGDVAATLRCFEHALSMFPDDAPIHVNFAFALLSAGDLVGGFAEYEWRLRMPGSPIRYHHEGIVPRWQGENLSGKALYIECEQGFGDALQFARYIPLLIKAGARVTVGCKPELMSLFQSSFPDAHCRIARSDEQFDFALPLLSIPCVLGTELSTIPSHVPYLAASTSVVSRWARELPSSPFRVGIVWSGSPSNTEGRDRSIPMSLLAQLFTPAGMHIVSLQTGAARSDIDAASVRDRVDDLGSGFRDFQDTAAVMSMMDLIITIDTASAHLAGALGKPVWVLLPAVHDWRWKHGGERSTWYPSMRLFPQSEAGDWQAVIDSVENELRKLIAKRSADIYNRGKDAKDSGDLPGAQALFHDAARLTPDDHDILFMQANTALLVEDYDEALAGYAALLRIADTHVGGLINCGVAFQRSGRLDDSIACFERALSLEPENIDAHWNRGYSLLLKETCLEGWRECEWRWRRPHFASMLARHTQPRWDGAPLAGKNILLWVEQGFGDALQFVRYVPLVHARGGHVILACQPELEDLFRGVEGIERVITWGDPIPDHDLQIPLVSLPFVFETSEAGIPARVPYLHATRTRQFVARKAGEMCVGMVWAGNPQPDPHRSIDPAMLSPLASVPHIHCVSLQKTDTPPPLWCEADASTELTDFAATAACIAALDLVISVDTAVAHLAGGMGKPVWLLLPYAPDWRWKLSASTSAWYPTMRIIRQQRPGQWSDVIEQIVSDLTFVADNMWRQAKTSSDRVESATQAKEYIASGKFSDAEELFRSILTYSPLNHEVLNNLGLTLLRQERIDEAISYLREAIRLQPEYVEAHFNLGLALLTAGDYSEGWREYAWRLQRQGAVAMATSDDSPVWEGSPLSGKTILLSTEQGHGDAIQFARFIPAVIARGGRVILECHPSLMDLFRTIPDIAGFVSAGDTPPPHAYHCALMDLPRILGVDTACFRSAVPYLHPDPQRRDRWRQELDAYAPALLIGVAWTGNPLHEQNARRSIDPNLLCSLARMQGVTLVSLQVDSGSGAAPGDGVLVDETSSLTSFAETAALISALDLVIAVDTSVVHLAGALGIPVWTLVHHGPDWRWGLTGSASAWYSSMRVYRQKVPDSWDDVMNAIVKDLPMFVAGLNNAGVAFIDHEEYDQAIRIFGKVLAVNPDDFRALNNLGRALHESGDTNGAIACFHTALQGAPESPDIHNNCGNACQDLGRYDEAIAHYRQAIALRNDFVEAHWNLSLALLLTGDLREGWREYEWRWRKSDFSSPHRHGDLPRWDGSSPGEKIVLVHAEQGFGDAIQFVRYVPLIAGWGVRIVVECHPELTRLFTGVEGVAGVFTFGETLPHCDVQIPLMSLPGIVGTDSTSIPAEIPYLKSPPPAMIASRSDGDLTVGVVWSGNPHWKSLRHRSIEGERLLSHVSISGVTVVSLQMGPAREELRESYLHDVCLDPSDGIRDFTDTAALIAACDVVISIDTGVAHLAAALGKSVWLLLPRKADWRWGTSGETSPWYPTMRLFRQSVEGEWDPVLDRVTVALREAVGVAAFHRGNELKQMRDYRGAGVAYSRAIESGLDRAEVWNNLGLVRKANKDFEGAAECYHHAIACDASFVLAYANLGYLETMRGNLVEAIQFLREATRLSPEYVDAHWLLSHVLLLSGDYEEGWKEYEWRWRKEDYAARERKFAGPRWRGEDLRGKTILLWTEQGLGDAMQFVRYAPLVKAFGGKVIVECQQFLSRLFLSAAGIDQVIARGTPVPPFDVHCPLMSVPAVLGTTRVTIPNDVPYLGPTVATAEIWARNLAEVRRDVCVVGIVWSGNPQHNDDRNRSVDVGLLRGLASVPGVRCVSLQKGEAGRRAEEIPAYDCESSLSDLEETAGAVSNVDLVITVDTAVAHLAGAMGKPVWVMIPAMPDWRWMVGRDDSPWYPTMRLYRQSVNGGWEGVVEAMTIELRRFSKAKAVRCASQTDA